MSRLCHDERCDDGEFGTMCDSCRAEASRDWATDQESDR